MGIDTDSKLLVGCNYNYLPKKFKEETDIYEWLENHEELTYASEWYDAGPDGMVIGVEIGTDYTAENIDDITVKIKAAFQVAEKLLGVKPQLICTPDVW